MKSEQTHPMLSHNNTSAHVIALCLKDVKEQGDAVLCGGHQLPDTVLVWGVLPGPAWAGDGAIQLGDEASTCSCRQDIHSREDGDNEQDVNKLQLLNDDMK